MSRSINLWGFIFLFLILLVLLPNVSAKNFTVYNFSNPTQIYFSINGNTGKIGIGTASPTQKLDVNGTVKATEFVGGGAGITGIKGSQITNDLNWVNYTSLSQFTNDLGIGNWTLDKPNYYNSTQVNTLISSGTSNDTNNLGGHPASFFMPLNKSVYGQYDFNGGWTNNGLSIIDGNIYAQTGYFYKINSLQVTNLAVNGSLIPAAGFDNQFDLGNSTSRWRDLNVGRNAVIGGTASITGNLAVNTNNLFVDTSTGRVGIGTTNPGAKLEVTGTLRSTATTNPTTGAGTEISYTSGAGFIFPFDRDLGAYKDLYLAGNDIYFGTNSIANPGVRYNRVVIKSDSGNVGIGTTAPQNKLNVVGDINATTNIYGNLIYQNGKKVLDTLDNTTIYNYINSQDALYNDSMKAYVDSLNVSQGTWTSENYVPYNGSTKNVDLNSYNLSAGTLNSDNVNTSNLQSNNVDTKAISITGNAKITGSIILGGANITANTNGDVNVW